MQTVKPTPQQIRDYLVERIKAKVPPPDPAEIRRQLGWFMLGKAPDCPR